MNRARSGEVSQACAADRGAGALTRKVMEAVVEPSNLNRAYRWVKANRGSPGVDGMSVGELGDWCRANKHELIESLLAGIDLEKFFDRVNHDVLMARLARHVAEVRVLRVVRRFLEAGMFSNGLEQRRYEGTPQGGPLSPLLANLLLTDLDRELERRGHAFCRYADDCNVYVRSRRSGERVMASVTRFLETRLKLKVNRAKSAVAPVGERKFLGYRIADAGRLEVAPASLVRLRAALKAVSSRSRGVSLERTIEQINARTVGWVRYYALAHYGDAFRETDRWLRRRLRCARFKQCKRAFGSTRFLLARGLSREAAWTLALSGKGWWRLANTPQASRAMPVHWFDALGLLSLQRQYAALLPLRKPPDTLSTSGGVGGRPA